MGPDNEAGRRDRDSYPDADDGLTLEPEIVRWLEIYAEAEDARRDDTVAAIFDEVNRLLRRYRTADLTRRVDYGSRLRTLTERMPVLLWTTDDRLRVTTFAGGGLAAVDIDPASTMSLPLTVVLGTDTPSPDAVDAHERALRGHPASFEYGRRARSYLAHVQPLSGPGGDIVGTIGLAIDVTRRKRAEEALARREQQLAAAQRLAQIGSWDWHAGETVPTWSQELYRIWGLDPRTFQPTLENIQSRIHPEDRATFHAVRDRAILTGNTSRGVFRIVRPDGEIRHVSVLMTATHNSDGDLVRIHGASQDITEREQAEEAARATHRMLEHLLECFPNGAIGVFDTDLRYVVAAGRILTHFGLTPQRMIGRALAELFPPDAVAVVEGPYRRAFGGETVAVEVPLAGRIFLVSAAPLDHVDGAVRTIVAVAQDITEGHLTEPDRRLNEERFQVALRGTPITVFSQDADLRHTWIYNPSPGFSPEEIIGNTDEEIHTPETAATLTMLKRRVLETGVGTRQEVPVILDGEPRYYDVKIEPLRSPAGDVVGITGAATDVTERKQAEEERALWRERQARLDGMLFAVRELASRVTRTLAAAPEAGAMQGPASPVPSSLDEALDAAQALTRALDDIAELQRQIPSE